MLVYIYRRGGRKSISSIHKKVNLAIDVPRRTKLGVGIVALISHSASNEVQLQLKTEDEEVCCK